MRIAPTVLDIEVLGTPDEVARLARAKLPILLKANMDESKKLWLNPLPVLQKAGYRIASHPGVVRYAVVRAAREALAHLKEHRSPRFHDIAHGIRIANNVPTR